MTTGEAATRGPIAVAVAACVVGCSARTIYEPATARQAADRDASVQIVRMTHFTSGMADPGRRGPDGESHDITVRARIRAPASRVAGVSIVSSYESGCATGPAWSVVRGTSEAGEIVDVGAPSMRGPSRLDVLLVRGDGEERCLRLPLVGDSQQRWELVSADRWSLGFSVRLEAPLGAESRIGAPIVIPVSVARWVGPVRVGAGAGLGFGRCPPAVCPNEDDVDESVFIMPVDAGFEWFFLGRWYQAVGIAARHALRLTWLPGASRPRHVVHAPHVAPLWVLDPSTQSGPGLPAVPRSTVVGVELPIGIWHDATADEPTTGWWLGVGAIMFAPFGT